MSGQEQALLEILLSEDNYVSYEILAEKMNVSSRTVMRLVKNLESFLENFSIVIVGQGFYYRKNTLEKNRFFQFAFI